MQPLCSWSTFLPSCARQPSFQAQRLVLREMSLKLQNKQFVLINTVITFNVKHSAYADSCRFVIALVLEVR